MLLSNWFVRKLNWAIGEQGISLAMLNWCVNLLSDVLGPMFQPVSSIDA